MGKIKIINKALPPSPKNIKTKKNRDKTLETKNDSVELSSRAISINNHRESAKSSDIRAGMVKKFKEGISNGTYKVKTEEIAEKLMQKLKEEVFFKLPL